MKLVYVACLALGLLLAADRVESNLYETYINAHVWSVGHYVGACTLQVWNRMGIALYGWDAWTGLCICHTLSSQRSGFGLPNVGLYMRNLLSCTLTSSTAGVGVIGAAITTCVANKINQVIETGGK